MGKAAGIFLGVIIMVVILIGGAVEGIFRLIFGSSPGSSCGLAAMGGGSGLNLPLAPNSYTLTSPFGQRTNPVTGVTETHQGQDFAAPTGTPIHAAADGHVAAAGPVTGFGQWIVLDHVINGQSLSTVYGHMWPDGVRVRAGEQVRAGQTIGTVGSNGESTGPHLHFEVWTGSRLRGGAPVDPMPWLSASPATTGGTVSESAPSLDELMPRRPTVAQTPINLSDEQHHNAGVIVSVGKGMGLPPRAWVIAIAAALRESTLINLDHGDRDSVGLFQQRPSQGWGRREQIMDPTYAAQRFYEALKSMVIANTPDWQTRPLTDVIQTVQRSAMPHAYGQWERAAVNTVLAVHGVAPTCVQTLA